MKPQNPTEKKTDTRRLRTPPFRMSFPCLPPMAPREMDTGGKTYQLTMLFPPDTPREPFLHAMQEAMIAKFGKDKKNWPRCRQTPEMALKDFGKFNAEAKTPLSGDWDGWLMIRANTKAAPDLRPPEVVGPIRGPDGRFEPVTDLRMIYGGRWAWATIEAYYFDIKGKNNGLTFGLGNVQLLKDDTRFGLVRPRAEDEFEDAPEQWSGQGDAFESGEARNW